VNAKVRGGVAREDRLTAFVVRPDREVAQVDLGPFEPIRAAVDEWRKDTGRRKPVRDSDDPAAVLRDTLWRPVAEHLDGVETVLVSPDRDLAKLPFAALPSSKDGNYLVEEMGVAVVPVPQFLPDLLTPLPAGKPSLLTIGDVDYGATDRAESPAVSDLSIRGNGA
jgi:CHAT domain-containing protein